MKCPKIKFPSNYPLYGICVCMILRTCVCIYTPVYYYTVCLYRAYWLFDPCYVFITSSYCIMLLCVMVIIVSIGNNGGWTSNLNMLYCMLASVVSDNIQLCYFMLLPRSKYCACNIHVPCNYH